MAKVAGSASIEIEAPIETVFAVVADVEGAPRWQPELQLAECLERDGDGRTVLARMESNIRVRATVRFEFRPPTRIGWEQVEGDLRSVVGNWEFEQVDGERTRATYSLEADPGLPLGLVVRGPVARALGEHLIEGLPARLKRFVEEEANPGRA